MDLSLDTHEQDGWWVVTVSGEIDIATAPRLRSTVIDLVGRQHRGVIVELESVDFIDSTGLGVLVGALKRVRTHGGELRIVCSNSRVLKVFAITGLDGVFQITSTLDEATG